MLYNVILLYIMNYAFVLKLDFKTCNKGMFIYMNIEAVILFICSCFAGIIITRIENP